MLRPTCCSLTTQASELTRYQSSQRHSFCESKMTLAPTQLSATSNVVATDAGSRRRLLAVEVTVSFTVIMPTTPGSEQATFDTVVSDLSAAASAGGALETGALASLATVETAAYVPPTAADMVTVDGADSCVGANVIFDSQNECRCEDWYLVSSDAWVVSSTNCVTHRPPSTSPPPLNDLTTYSHPTRARLSGRPRSKPSPT